MMKFAKEQQLLTKQTLHWHSCVVTWNPVPHNIILKQSVICELFDLSLSMLVQCGLLILPKLSIMLKWSKGELLDLYMTSTYHNRVSVSSMLESLGWPTLQARRNYLKLLLTYKILKAMISIPSNNFKPTQEDTNPIFNACKLFVIATVSPFFHLQ